MEVKTRSGRMEPLDLIEIKRKMTKSINGMPGINQAEIELNIATTFQNGMTTQEINTSVIGTMVDMIDYDKPNMTYAAANMVLNEMYHKVGHYYQSEKGSPYAHSLGQYITACVEEKKMIDFSKWYSDEEIAELDKHIKPENDMKWKILADGSLQGMFTYLGIKTWLDKYAIYSYEGELMELPQHMFMAVGMFLHAEEKKDRVKHIVEFYDAISDFEIMMATPTLSNARRIKHQLSSCFIGTMRDQLAPEEEDPNHTLYDGILGAETEMAILSKHGGGIGWDWTNIRASEGDIDGYQGVAGGPIPFLHKLNGLPLAVDQLGTRKGAIAVYLEPWHLNIEGFLDLKKNSGEERLRAHDLFPALWINDLFMERVQADEEWTMFDPYQLPDMHKAWGDDFKAMYEAAEGNPNFRQKKIRAKELWGKMLTSYMETGTPFLCFKDNANKVNKNKHIGSILSSNLCTEIFQVTDDGRTAICNLGSVNLARITTPERTREVSRILTRALDLVIDMNLYPIKKIKKTAMDTRAIGVGTMGEAEAIVHEGILYGSAEHKEWIKKTYRHIRQSVEDMSHELALEKGSYPEFEGSGWERPMRNGYLMAVAPTSSISILVGTTQSTEPVYKKKWYEENLSGIIPVTAPSIHPNNYNLYVNAFEVDPLDMADCAGLRQAEVDQGLSFNNFIDPAKVTGRYVSELFIKIWSLGIKSAYYLRSKSADESVGLDVDKDVMDRSMECSGCQ